MPLAGLRAKFTFCCGEAWDADNPLVATREARHHGLPCDADNLAWLTDAPRSHHVAHGELGRSRWLRAQRVERTGQRISDVFDGDGLSHWVVSLAARRPVPATRETINPRNLDCNINRQAQRNNFVNDDYPSRAILGS